MLRKLLLSVALAVCVSTPGLADISQFQDFNLGLGSVINLLGTGQESASNISALTLSLDQLQTQPSGLSALQGGISFGQPIQPLTTGIAFGGQTLTLGLIPSGALNAGGLSLLNGLPVLTAIQLLQ